MLIDTHAHLNFNAFKEDADKIIQETLEEETWMINVGSDYKTSKRALEYANKYEQGVYAAVGIHPMQLEEMQAKGDDYDFKTRGEDFNYDIFEKLAKFDKVVAIGEVGLDYYHLDPKTINVQKAKEKQKEVFYQQLLLARRLDKPVIIHCRQAHDDMLLVLNKFRKENSDIVPKNRAWGVMHCFSGDEDLAWKYFSLGLIVSFTGLITFSKQWDDLIRKMPNDKFIIETDSPYLTPEPNRGKRNEPVFVRHTVEFAAQLLDVEIRALALDAFKTACGYFSIPFEEGQ